MVPEDVAVIARGRRQHLGDHSVPETFDMAPDISEPHPRELLADPLGAMPHRLRHNKPADFTRPVHRTAQPQISMPEHLAQASGVALVAVDFEVVVRALRRAMLADDHRGAGNRPRRDLLGAEDVDRAGTVDDSAAKRLRRTREHLDHLRRIRGQVDRIELAREAQQAAMVGGTGFANEKGRLRGVHESKDSSTPAHRGDFVMRYGWPGVANGGSKAHYRTQIRPVAPCKGLS